MDVFTTKDGAEHGYICASCPTCLASVIAATKAKLLLDAPSVPAGFLHSSAIRARRALGGFEGSASAYGEAGAPVDGELNHPLRPSVVLRR